MLALYTSVCVCVDAVFVHVCILRECAANYGADEFKRSIPPSQKSNFASRSVVFRLSACVSLCASVPPYASVRLFVCIVVRLLVASHFEGVSQHCRLSINIVCPSMQAISCWAAEHVRGWRKWWPIKKKKVWDNNVCWIFTVSTYRGSLIKSVFEYLNYWTCGPCVICFTLHRCSFVLFLFFFNNRCCLPLLSLKIFCIVSCFWNHWFKRWWRG